jgi:hypothetical protein
MTDMKYSQGIALLLLLGAPALAAADPSDNDLARCTDVATRFHDNPRALTIGDLDVMRGCINRQQDLLRAAQRSDSSERRLARASLRDDL